MTCRPRRHEASERLGGEYDEKASESLGRNLIYVAISRAMDRLSVFAMEEANSEISHDFPEFCSEIA